MCKKCKAKFFAPAPQHLALILYLLIRRKARIGKQLLPSEAPIREKETKSIYDSEIRDRLYIPP